MARTRSENYDGIHLGILTNAARLFSAQGYMRASIADLADACQLSRGALYHYFDSKEAILFAILDAHVRTDDRRSKSPWRDSRRLRTAFVRPFVPSSSSMRVHRASSGCASAMGRRILPDAGKI